MAQRIQRDPHKEAQWRERLARQAASGLSIAGWCRRNGIPDSLFHFWKRTIARGEAGRVRPQPRLRAKAREPAPFAQVVIAPPFQPVQFNLCAAGAIEIMLAGGQVVRVAPGFDAPTLSDVLAVLERRSC